MSGSRVNGRSHDGSDLDLALRSPTLEPLDGGFYDLLEAIEKSNIPFLVQAHDWAMLPESFHREIERDYVVLQEGMGTHTKASPPGVARGNNMGMRVDWPWNTVRNRRTPRASLPGADLVGFYRENDTVLLLFGEVKTSSDTTVHAVWRNGRVAGVA